MWNSEWEYNNQDTLKAWYQQKISGEKPNLAVRRIICKGCGREFYTQVDTKKYCLYSLCGNRGYQKELTQRRREARQDRLCKCCGKAFTPCGLLLKCLQTKSVSTECYGYSKCSK